MVHTIQLSKLLTQEDLDYINKKFNNDFIFIEEELNSCFEGSSTTIRRYNKFSIRLYLSIDVVKVLGRSHILEEDYLKIERYINRYANHLLGGSINDLTLIRIDYRIDVRVTNKKHREFLLNIYRNKTINKYRFKEKNSLYESSIYYNNKSVKNLIYDKEIERRDKKIEPQEYEKGIIRFECAVLNKHLNGNKYRKNIGKELRNYFHKQVFEEYMFGSFEKLLHKGDYYKLYKAETIIKNSKFKNNQKNEMREFLVQVSRKGIEKVKITYSKYKFKKIIINLESLNINPITIPKNLIIDSFIKNPFKMESIKNEKQSA